MKIVIPGGTGQIGGVLARAFCAQNQDVVILTRRARASNHVPWDGETLGPWADEIDGCDVVINLAGRSVDCRYTTRNLQQMMRSRVRSGTAVLGR